MKKDLANFLQFNGRNIYVLTTDGTSWVAIKPICEALSVHYQNQMEVIKEDSILGQLYGKHRIVAADNKLREMVCLPERYIYGWLFSIRSDSLDLKAYKLECYNLLYDHFHGVMTQRLQVLREKSEAELEIERCTIEVLQTDAYQRLLAAKAKVKASNRLRTKLDRDLLTGQTSLFESEPS